ncbi:MAG: hypothetical protein ACTHMF_10080 [Leifsonia sp.]|uniref:iron chaperone n=1 Tax=Leifsonia sp. TaxID=1870902 RepID=UPI003F8012C0
MAKTETRTDASERFTDEERDAMKQRNRELKSSKKLTPEDQLAELLAKIESFDETDRPLAERIHRLITEAAPDLAPRLWYGMPAYYKGTKNIVFFQPAAKFKARYSTLGFNDAAALDDGTM